MTKIAPYWKAVVAFITPGAATIGVAVTDASAGGSAITGAEWVTAVVACLLTAGAVYTVPNRDPEGTHQDESTQPPYAGEGA